MDFNWNEIREKEFPALKKNINLKAAGGSPMSKSAYNSNHIEKSISIFKIF